MLWQIAGGVFLGGLPLLVLYALDRDRPAKLMAWHAAQQVQALEGLRANMARIAEEMEEVRAIAQMYIPR